MKEFWNERYGKEEYAYGQSANDFVVDASRKLPPGGQVLCLGAGEGRNAVYLASKGFDVTAIDSSEAGIDKTKKLAEKKGVKVNTACIDVAEYTFEEEHWDAIVMVFFHLPPPLRERVFAKLEGALKPSGMILLEAYTPAQVALKTGGPPAAEMMIDLEILRASFSMKEHIAREVIREIHEGEFHEGESATVQWLSEKKA